MIRTFRLLDSRGLYPRSRPVAIATQKKNEPPVTTGCPLRDSLPVPHVRQRWTIPRRLVHGNSRKTRGSRQVRWETFVASEPTDGTKRLCFPEPPL
jgi:hypothetical protein